MKPCHCGGKHLHKDCPHVNPSPVLVPLRDSVSMVLDASRGAALPGRVRAPEAEPFTGHDLLHVHVEVMPYGQVCDSPLEPCTPLCMPSKRTSHAPDAHLSMRCAHITMLPWLVAGVATVGMVLIDQPPRASTSTSEVSIPPPRPAHHLTAYTETCARLRWQAAGVPHLSCPCCRQCS